MHWCGYAHWFKITWRYRHCQSGVCCGVMADPLNYSEVVRGAGGGIRTHNPAAESGERVVIVPKFSPAGAHSGELSVGRASLILTVGGKVVQRGPQPRRIVIDKAQQPVALVTQQCPNLACRMVMVHDERVRLLPTNSASTTLLACHIVVLAHRQAVTMLQLPCLAIPPIILAAESRLEADVVACFAVATVTRGTPTVTREFLNRLDQAAPWASVPFSGNRRQWEDGAVARPCEWASTQVSPTVLPIRRLLGSNASA